MRLFARRVTGPEDHHVTTGEVLQSNIIRIEPTAREADSHTPTERDNYMRDLATHDMSALNTLPGFIGACLVDSESGMMIASEGGHDFDLETAAAVNTEVVRAKMRAIRSLELDDEIEDILISLGRQYHLIRPLSDDAGIFFYVALDRAQANLAMARVTLRKLDIL
ncbi:roadblock/LC7 domain-containing protein [Pontivivens insulae]|uniref:roadblock/LC7 domain-containing protein n=1 Tax=Pontivivens insulae TaxID=1639689 RepID=UPI001FE5A605|nr:roadblock/LC7 domain-containing protein [Pontivivens insulae]